jgi:hypothetical protein
MGNEWSWHADGNLGINMIAQKAVVFIFATMRTRNLTTWI